MRCIRGGPVFLSVLIVFALFLASLPASAQYIYIDTNGDGMNTWADSLNSTGTTPVDIWINTGFNRNGSRGNCPDAGMTSFSLNLRAVGGTVNWGTFSSAIASAQGPPAVSNPTEYHIALVITGSSTTTPLGLYKLGTLPVDIVSGTPCLDFATSTSMSPRHSTSFGAGCPGPQFDHTSRLGSDWRDQDGLPANPSAAPRVFAPGIVVPKYLEAVSVDVQAVASSCGNISSLTADLSALPPGNDAVFTPGPGNTSGTLTWQPTAADQGDFIVTFQAAGKNPNSTDSHTTIIHLPSVSGTEGSTTPAVLALWPARPNPFNPATTIAYSVPTRARVRLVVYDIAGRAVARLVDREETPGRHEVHWPGVNDRGQALASGVYVCRLSTTLGNASSRLVLTK